MIIICLIRHGNDLRSIARCFMHTISVTNLFLDLYIVRPEMLGIDCGDNP